MAKESTVEKSSLFKQQVVREEEFNFKVILKFWKKDSKSTEVIFKASECATKDDFVLNIKKRFEIRSAHCLEEIWVLQLAKDYDKKLEWVKEISGRIILPIPFRYKEFLMEKGSNLHQDPPYQSDYE